MYELLRETEVDLKRYLPDYLFTDPSFKKIMEALSTYQEQQRQELIDVFKQFFISSATWGLTDWERVYGIVPESGIGYDIRRAALKIKKAGAATITNQLISWMINQYCPQGDARYIDNAGDGYAIVELNSTSSVESIRKTLDAYVPAHIIFDIIARPQRQIILNSAGSVKTITTPGESWIERINYTLFDVGANAAGPVTSRIRESTVTTDHSAYVFTGGRLNNRLMLNGGDCAIESRDIGGEITTSWDVFTGQNLNSRASPLLNNAPRKTMSRTDHFADWQDVVNYHGTATNDAEKQEIHWKTSQTRQTHETYFTRPFFALNMAGNAETFWEDIGSDIEVTDTVFVRGLNGAPCTSNKRTTTGITTTRYKNYRGGRLNGKNVRVSLNNAISEQYESVVEITATTVSRLFAGWTLSGRSTLNSCQSDKISRTVHVSKWRNVVHRSNGSILNSCRSTVRTIEIQHQEPASVSKVFDPAIGTLFNNHAVLGYLKL